MSPWLATATEAVLRRNLTAVPNVPIAPEGPSKAGFGTIDANGTAPVIAASDVPFAFEDDLARLRSSNPTDDDRRWRQACDDASRFLRRWGDLALALEWTPEELFGLHPTAPLARYDAMGLTWLLGGRRIVSLTDRAAEIEDGRRIRRQGVSSSSSMKATT